LIRDVDKIDNKAMIVKTSM